LSAIGRVPILDEGLFVAVLKVQGAASGRLTGAKNIPSPFPCKARRCASGLNALPSPSAGDARGSAVAGKHAGEGASRIAVSKAAKKWNRND
jgi:hypothetical protein